MAPVCRGSRKGKKRGTETSEVAKEADREKEQIVVDSVAKKYVPSFGKASKSPANKKRKVSEHSTKLLEGENSTNDEQAAEAEEIAIQKMEIKEEKPAEDAKLKEQQNHKENSIDSKDAVTIELQERRFEVTSSVLNEENTTAMDTVGSCYIEIEKIHTVAKVKEEGNERFHTNDCIGKDEDTDAEQKEIPKDKELVTKTFSETEKMHETSTARQHSSVNEMQSESKQQQNTFDTVASPQNNINLHEPEQNVHSMKVDDKQVITSAGSTEELDLNAIDVEGKNNNQTCSENRYESSSIMSDAMTVKVRSSMQPSTGMLKQGDSTVVNVSADESLDYLPRKEDDNVTKKNPNLQKDWTEKELSSETKESSNVKVVHYDDSSCVETAVNVLKGVKNVASEIDTEKSAPVAEEDADNEVKNPEIDQADKNETDDAEDEATISNIAKSKDMVGTPNQDATSHFEVSQGSILQGTSIGRSNVDSTNPVEEKAYNDAEGLCIDGTPQAVQNMNIKADMLSEAVDQNNDSKCDFNDAEMTSSQIFMLDEEITTSPARKPLYEDFNDAELRLPMKTLEDYASEGSVIMKGLIDELSSVTKMIVGMKRHMDSVKKQKQTKIYSMWK